MHRDEPESDAWVEQLVHFDEALRLGRNPAAAPALDAPMLQTQAFLVRLQSVWRRTPKKIGPYTIVRSLGQGSVGPAYLVDEPGTHRPGVLKILWPDLSAVEKVRRQFVRDAKNVQTVRHAGIAAVRDVREVGSVCMVVTEQCAGVSLAQWRQTKLHSIPWQAATALVARIADILDAAQCQGITHGNLKPSNIFLSHAAEITADNLHEASLCVCDFALAHAVQESRVSVKKGLPWPAPHYLAPEQLHRHTDTVPAASDLYALGVLWYELMTSRSPVKGTAREEILAQTRSFSPAPPRQYRPEIPEEIETLLMQTLSKNPHDRPACAKQLAILCRTLLPTVVEPNVQPAWWKQWLGWM